MENCYRTDRALQSEKDLRELESTAFAGWLSRLSGHGIGFMLVGLILKLERMVNAPVKPAQRLLLIHWLMPIVRDVAEELPKLPEPPPAGTAKGEPLSLEQRLMCLTVRNLKLALEGLDGADGVQVAGRDAARLWVLQALMECLGRQVELGIRWNKRWPRQTWQELHDLYAYYLDRVRPAVNRAEAGAIGGEGFDMELAYKRLLVIGLLAELGPTGMMRDPASERVAEWARQSQLRDATSETGSRGSFTVEMSSDAPPRRSQGAADTVRRTMILRLPPEPTAALEAVLKGKPAFLKP
jgi:hypothetical protein